MSNCLIDRILPANRISLCGGISSAGKTRFWVPALCRWAKGVPVLGLKSHPIPWCLVSSDRPVQDVYDSLNGMKIPKGEVNVIPAFGIHAKARYKVMEAIVKSGAKLVYWEGFDMLVKNPNNPFDVGQMLSEVSAFCEAEDGLTILGTVGVAKLKPHETYANPRQLIAGSSIWERATSTNFVIVATHPGNIESGQRLLYVCLKDTASFATLGDFSDGGFLTFQSWENRISGEELERVVSNMKKVR